MSADSVGVIHNIGYRSYQGERLGRMELRLGEHGERLESIDHRLDGHSQMQAEILRRPTGGASNVPSGGPNDH